MPISRYRSMASVTATAAVGRRELMPVPISDVEVPLAPLRVSRLGVWYDPGIKRAHVCRVNVLDVDDDPPPPGPGFLRIDGHEVYIPLAYLKAREARVEAAVTKAKAERQVELDGCRHVVCPKGDCADRVDSVVTSVGGHRLSVLRDPRAGPPLRLRPSQQLLRPLQVLGHADLSVPQAHDRPLGWRSGAALIVQS